MRRGVAVLAARGVDLGVKPQEWSLARPGEEWLCTSTGNVVRRRCAGVGAGGSEWIRFADEVSAARGVGAIPALGKVAPGEKPGPVYLNGIDPPWLLMRVAAERPRDADGHAPGIVVVVEDPMEVLDAVAAAPALADLLADERVTLIVGPGGASAAAALERRLTERLATNLGSVVLGAGGGGGSRADVAGPVLRAARQRQAAAGSEAIATAARMYAGRDAGWWSARLGRALSPGSGEPLRVLIPTTRFSTYVRHASADLARGLESHGWRARVLEEPDETATLVRWAYARAVAEFEPDLIVMINYPRRHLAGVIPEGVPVVCWVQDAMPHLFDRASGRSQGPLDFLAGHLHMSFFDVFEYPMDRALAMPVLASAAKFHRGPVEPGLASRMTCEIACVTHHSQTPADLRLRMLTDALARPDGAAARRMIESIAASIEGIADGSMAAPMAGRVRAAVVRGIADAGREPSDDLVARVGVQVAWPLLDRVIRHQVLAWAAEIAERRGWRLNLYGRGWEKHPRLGRHARGELHHGEELRAAYRCAAVNLHASAHTNLHQRVMECALSGGLPLCRLTMDHLCHLGGYAAACLSASGAAIEQRPGDPTPTASAADHWTGLALLAQLQRLGIDPGRPGGFHVGEHPVAAGRVPIVDAVRRQPWRYNAGVPEPWAIPWLLGDLSETTFWSAATLEARVERAVDPAWSGWRGSLIEGIGSRVRAELTYESAASRLVRFVAERLAAPPCASTGGACTRAA